MREEEEIGKTTETKGGWSNEQGGTKAQKEYKTMTSHPSEQRTSSFTHCTTPQTLGQV